MKVFSFGVQKSCPIECSHYTAFLHLLDLGMSLNMNAIAQFEFNHVCRLMEEMNKKISDSTDKSTNQYSVWNPCKPFLIIILALHLFFRKLLFPNQRFFYYKKW